MIHDEICAALLDAQWLEIGFEDSVAPTPVELRRFDDVLQAAVILSPDAGELIVSRPEVRGDPGSWPADRFFDGARIARNDVPRLARSMLVDGNFWCLLESPELAVHPYQDVLWLGVDRGRDTLLQAAAGLSVRKIPRSPYLDDRRRSCDLAAADDAFWDRVATQVAQPGRCVIQVQWAGGAHGSWWFAPAHAADTADIRSRVPPRSIVACYHGSRVIEPGDDARLDRLAHPDGDDLDDVLPVFLLQGAARLRRYSVSTWDMEEFRAARRRADFDLVVAAPRYAALAHSDVLEAAVPDDDGLIRSWLAYDRA